MMTPDHGRWGCMPAVRVALVALSSAFVLFAATTAHAERRFAWHMNTLSGGVGPTRLIQTHVKLTGGMDGTRAWYFNGHARARTAAGVDVLNPRRARFSVTVHVRFRTIPSRAVGDYDLIRKGTPAEGLTYWKLEILPNATFTKALAFCQVRGRRGSVGIMKAPALPLNDGHWHKITCTRSRRHVELAIDRATWIKPGRTGSVANNAPLLVGAKLDPLDDEYVGRVENVALRIGT